MWICFNHRQKNKLLGIFTDGDMRRMISKGISFEGKVINDMMTKKPQDDR